MLDQASKLRKLVGFGKKETEEVKKTKEDTDFILKVNQRLQVMYEEVSYICNVTEVYEDDEEEWEKINAPVNSGKVLMLDVGEEINCNAIAGDKIVKFKVEIEAKTTEDGRGYYQISPPYDVEKIQRRRFVRVNLGMEAHLYDIGEEGDKIENLRPIYMIDISAGGCKIRTQFPVTAGDVYNIRFILKDKMFVEKGEIIRVEKMGTSIYMCAVKFPEITQEEVEKIISQLFILMRENRSKGIE